jgi:sec-independent protein translocase protein TatA
MFLGFLGPLEMLIIVALIILLFGAKRLPTMMRSIGQSVTEFKKGISDSGDRGDPDDADDPDDSITPKDDRPTDAS